MSKTITTIYDDADHLQSLEEIADYLDRNRTRGSLFQNSVF
jgi:hypothetical protein